MKTYLTSITRSDAPEPYPFRLEAETLSDAIVKSVVRSLSYLPAKGKAAFCSVNVYEVETVETKE
jgi:hypothetical protein